MSNTINGLSYTTLSGVKSLSISCTSAFYSWHYGTYNSTVKGNTIIPLGAHLNTDARVVAICRCTTGTEILLFGPASGTYVFSIE